MNSVPFGLCHCGCGGKTNIAVRSDPGCGWSKGEPYPYLSNHRKRIRLDIEVATAVVVEGEYCYQIPLNNGRFSLISERHLDKVMRLKWRARKNARSDTWYAMRTEGKATMMLHNFITGAAPGEVDHHNLNGLDNRDRNLRFCCSGQNQMNVGIRSDNSSGYKGVSWHKRASKWTANISLRGVRKHIGYFHSPEAAARAYDAAARELHGEFGRTNFLVPAAEQAGFEGRW